jgi:hypothetical protein
MTVSRAYSEYGFTCSGTQTSNRAAIRYMRTDRELPVTTGHDPPPLWSNGARGQCLEAASEKHDIYAGSHTARSIESQALTARRLVNAFNYDHLAALRHSSRLDNALELFRVIPSKCFFVARKFNNKD